MASPDARRQCLVQLMPHATNGIDDQAYENAAKELKVEVAVIKAIASVETKGSAFDKEGRPTILYERHYFHRLTAGKYSKKNPDISNSSSGGYGKFSAQYGKLEKAYKLAPDAALMSASWGRFQIMGANHVNAGHATVEQFVTAHMVSETNHLKAFVSLLSNETRMLKALQAKDWAKFARAYNGPKYKENDYDTKMREAYEALQPKKPARK